MKRICISFVLHPMLLLITAVSAQLIVEQVVSKIVERPCPTVEQIVEKPCANDDCPNGWIRYESSCYFISRWENRKTYPEAQNACLIMNATMFSSDSENEWTTIMQHAERLGFTWIGITVGDWRNGEEFFKWDDDKCDWSPQMLPWLSNATATRGHYSTADCVSYHGVDAEEKSYVNWYPCETARYYICERNNTASVN